MSDRRGNNLRCSLLPARSASFCSAQLRSVKPQIIHSLRYETEEEGETEGGNDGETRSSTHSGTDKLSAFCLSIVSAETHSLPPSQFGYRISTRGEDPHLCFISVFKFGSNICLTFPPLLLLFFLCPWRSEVVWLVNPGRPRLIALCITPQEKETDLQTDKEREKPGRKKRMRK